MYANLVLACKFQHSSSQCNQPEHKQMKLSELKEDKIKWNDLAEKQKDRTTAKVQKL